MVRVSNCPFEPSIKGFKVSHVIVECRVIRGGGGGGGSGLSLWKKGFRVTNWRGRPGHVPGSFGCISAILTM